MEDELISQLMEKRIIKDLKYLIGTGEPGKIYLGDYIMNNNDACMDFAMFYESSDDLQYFIEQERLKGVEIEVEEDNISVIRYNY
jgi:serine/threonine-protein kinase RIO1